MKKLIFILLVFTMAGVSANAQTDGKAAFRPNKDQLIMAQKILKVTPSGKVDTATRNALKKFQKEKALTVSGTLDRATMQTLGIGLTTAQREISDTNPPPPTTTPDELPKPASFTATKVQIIQAQKLLKEEGFYSGTTSGILNPGTREALKKYQAANDLEETGAFNQATLEKMEIQLTAKQKEDSSLSSN